MGGGARKKAAFQFKKSSLRNLVKESKSQKKKKCPYCKGYCRLKITPYLQKRGWNRSLFSRLIHSIVFFFGLHFVKRIRQSHPVPSFVSLTLRVKLTVENTVKRTCPLTGGGGGAIFFNKKGKNAEF